MSNIHVYYIQFNLLLSPIIWGVSFCRESVLNRHLTSSSVSPTWHGESHIFQEEMGASPIIDWFDMKENDALRWILILVEGHWDLSEEASFKNQPCSAICATTQRKHAPKTIFSSICKTPIIMSSKFRKSRFSIAAPTW